MLRNETQFPSSLDNALCSYIKKLWQEGWLNDYSDDHFLIKALEARLDNFIWDTQFINNNINYFYNVITKTGDIDYNKFSVNFCTNLSSQLLRMSNIFGEETIRKFVIDQLSAGKNNYKEDTFFQAFSEIEILTFFHRGFRWNEIKYEPPIGTNGANPEACFIGEFSNKDSAKKVKITANIEVKTPEFPRLTSHQENYLIPTVLLSKNGRKTLPDFCATHNVKFIFPRVNKLVEFINSATQKFNYPKENEYNLLYINWSYCDFPSNAFLEAWSLLTNHYNGLLTHPEIATTLPLKEPVLEEAYKKITAIIVYSSSIEQLMFCDFRHVWQRNDAGCKFRMFVVDEKLRQSELADESDLLFKLTGMNPDKSETLPSLFACASSTLTEKKNNAKFYNDVSDLIINNILN